MLGDPADVSKTDPAYTGATDAPGLMSLDYYRDKVREFQIVLNALDSAYQAGVYILADTVDESLASDLRLMLDEYDQKKVAFRLAAETLNAGASIINQSGGRFPNLSIPQSLGIAIPLPMLAVVGTVAALIVWGNTWITGLNNRLQTELEYKSKIAAAKEMSDPAARDRALAEIPGLQSALEQTRASTVAATGSPLSDIAGILKWGTIAIAGYLIYQRFFAEKK